LYILLNSEGPDGEYFKEYHITMNPAEKRLILDKLDKDVVELQRGFECGDPSQVGHIYDNPEYINRWTGKRWMCEGYCPYAEKCAVMRGSELRKRKTGLIN
jgi:hypothetical protein